MYSIGVDIGGMSVKIGLVNINGEIVDKVSFKTIEGYKNVAMEIVNSVRYLLDKNSLNMSDVKGMGIGCPGTINADTNIIENLPNLGWFGVDIVSILNKELPTEIVLANDANAALLGEVKFGVAKNYKNVIMLTVGTGVGGAVLIDGKLFTGNEGKGTELGHVTLVYNGRKCGCGRRGCVETYVSASALIFQAKKEMLKNRDSLLWKYVNNDIEKVNGKMCWEAEKEGDKTASKICNKFIDYLSHTIMSYCNIFRPDAIIIGGGISAQGKNVTDRIKAVCEKNYYGYKDAPKSEILCASLGNDAGIVGAAALID